MHKLPKPSIKPKSPVFSSGPTSKHPGWQLNQLPTDLLGRSHRSNPGKIRLRTLIDLTREVLEIPQDYRIGILPGSATGAIECALWSLLGMNGVDVFASDVFGHLWADDITNQLKLKDVNVYTALPGDLPNLSLYNPKNDCVLSWNGTTTGVCVPNAAWIPDDRLGLTIVDATSAAFSIPLAWHKFDATAFSWQKGLGGEAAHGMIVLSPRAVTRLTSYTPPWPMPRLFRLTTNQKLIEGIFVGETINTPSLLCIEDYIDALTWAKKIGGAHGLFKRCQQNFAILQDWVKKTPWIDFLASNPETVSPISVCLKIIDPIITNLSEEEQRRFIQKMTQDLDQETVAFDIRGHIKAPPSLRIWAGPTIETEDLKTLLPWLEWSFMTNRVL